MSTEDEGWSTKEVAHLLVENADLTVQNLALSAENERLRELLWEAMGDTFDPTFVDGGELHARIAAALSAAPGEVPHPTCPHPKYCTAASQCPKRTTCALSAAPGGEGERPIEHVSINRHLLYELADIARSHANEHRYTESHKGFVCHDWRVICDALDLAEHGEIRPVSEFTPAPVSAAPEPAEPDWPMTEGALLCGPIDAPEPPEVERRSGPPSVETLAAIDKVIAAEYRNMAGETPDEVFRRQMAAVDEAERRAHEEAPRIFIRGVPTPSSSTDAAPGVPVVDDGFGTTEGCAHPDCDIEVVRPGSVQCSGWCDTLTEQGGK